MRYRPGFLLAAALMAGPSSAQTRPAPPAQGTSASAPTVSSEPPADQPAIVVEGRRDSDEQITEFIKHLPHAGSDEHIARFEQATCPAVIGVAPQQKAFVESRMRKVAAAAGVPVGRPGCGVNVLVAIVEHKRPFIEQLAKRFPDFLGDLSMWQIARLKKDPGPTALWRMDGTLTEDGRELSPGTIDGINENRTTRTSSRLRDLAHPTITGSVLVIEAEALTGVTTTQLADYAAMRTLTGVNPTGCPRTGRCRS